MDDNFNLKLVIVNNLMYNRNNSKPSFEEEYNQILNSEEYKAEKKQIESKILYDEMCMNLYNYLVNLKISENDLDKIEAMYFDGGSQIYADLAPSWDGESDIFEVTSIDGIEKLKNLKKISVYSMVTREIEEKLESMLK